jgi:hypothetical protein
VAGRAGSRIRKGSPPVSCRPSATPEVHRDQTFVATHTLNFQEEDSHLMELLLHAVLTVLLLAVAAYVHMQLPNYTQAGAKVAIARTTLALVGIGFGLTGAAYVAGLAPQLLTFFSGFGLVHLPAAVILFVKSKRGAGKS